MTPVLRRATPDDAALISHHRDSMFLDMGIDPAVVAAASEPGREWVAAALADGRYVGVLAEHDGEVVGGVGVCWLDLPPNMHTVVDRRRYILNMYVHPGARGHGLARLLLSEALSVCRASGVTAVSLHASDAGRGLYAAAGFVPTSEMRLRVEI